MSSSRYNYELNQKNPCRAITIERCGEIAQQYNYKLFALSVPGGMQK
jgi:hypothetical protein